MIDNYNELKDALEKAGFILLEENIEEIEKDVREFQSGKWICHGGILEIFNIKGEGIDIRLNGNSYICHITGIDLKIKK